MVTVEQVLQKGWPKETDIVGPATVANLASGVAHGIPASELFRSEEGGGELDVHAVVTDMIQAAIVAKAAIEIIQIMKVGSDKPPTEAAVKAEVESKKLGVAKEVVQRVLAALKALLEIV